MWPDQHQTTVRVRTRSSGEPPSAHESFEVWDGRGAVHRAAWAAAWSESAGGDVFSHPAYLEQFREPGEVPCCAAYTSSTGERVLYAFLVRPIRSAACGHRVAPGHKDIYTALLYGGPISAGADEAVVAAFWSAFRSWARSRGIVSEFVRMSPVAARRLAYPGVVTEQAPHIVRDLSGTEEELRMDMKSNVRRGVRKAREAGVQIDVDDTGARLAEFLEIYYRTMNRNRAARRFYYPRQAFEAIHRTFPGRFAYVYAQHEGRAVSAELMLMSDHTGYFFLGGTEQEALRLYANVLVHWESIRYARARGLSEYVLTGGVTNTPDDSLLRFKRMFAPRGSASYLTGQQVFDQDQYHSLSCAESAETDYFPAYRDPLQAGSCSVHAVTAGTRSGDVR